MVRLVETLEGLAQVAQANKPDGYPLGSYRIASTSLDGETSHH
jgi:hypothetical protein